MKALKVFFATTAGFSLFFAVFSALLFNGDTITFDVGWISVCVCGVIFLISHHAYRTVKKIEKENADWMELLKKPNSDSRSHKGHK